MRKRSREENTGVEKRKRPICIFDGCGKIASYGIKKEEEKKNPVYCAEHFKKLPESEKDSYMDVVHKKCETCKLKVPNFNLVGEKQAKFCDGCKLPGMVNVKIKSCMAEGCLTRATCNFKDTYPPLYCSVHKLKDMVDLYTKKCTHSGCDKFAMYAKELGQSPIYCKVHGAENGCLLDTKSKRCEVSGCMKHAVMAVQGEGKRFCSEHARKKEAETGEKYINVKANLCGVDGCSKRATFGHSSTGNAQRCIQHYEEGMVSLNLKYKKCAEESCTSFGYYANNATFESVFCKFHKTESMTNIFKRKYCMICNVVESSYNFVGKPAEFCFSCKTEDMVDVKNNVCLVCGKRAKFGYLGKSPTHCGLHRQSNMYTTRFCQQKNCYAIPLYGNAELGIPVHCELHKDLDQGGEINLVERPCRICNLSFYLNKDNLCHYCNTNIYEKRREKELQVLEFLKNKKHFGDFFVSSDRMVDSKCSKARPDIVFDFKTFFLVVEVDEKAHSSYACEDPRMIEIFNSIGGSRVVFLRYNPDMYRDSKDEMKNPMCLQRYTFLKKFIDSLLVLDTSTREEEKSLLVAYYMYYNGFDGVHVPRRILLDKNPLVYSSF